MRFIHCNQPPSLVSKATADEGLVVCNTATFIDIYNLSRLYLWHLFDDSHRERGLPTWFGTGKQSFERITGDVCEPFNYGFPRFIDLIVYIYVLYEHRDVIPNAEEELKLFNQGIRVLDKYYFVRGAPEKGEYDASDEFIGIVDYIKTTYGRASRDRETFHKYYRKLNDYFGLPRGMLEQKEPVMIRDVTKNLVFTASATRNEEGLKRLSELVNAYTIVTVVDNSNVAIDNSVLGPDASKGDDCVEGQNKFDKIGGVDADGVLPLPAFIKKFVVFKAINDRDDGFKPESTVEDILNYYKGVSLDLNLNFDFDYYVIHDETVTNDIDTSIKSKIMGGYKVTNNKNVFRTGESPNYNFKVTLHVPEDFCNDESRVRRMFEYFYEIDPRFKILPLNSSLTMTYDGRIIEEVIEKAIHYVTNKIHEEHEKEKPNKEKIYVWRSHLQLLEQFRVYKPYSIVNTLDDDVFDLISPLYMHKEYTVTLYTDELEPLNRLKIMGIGINKVTYEYHRWKEILAYLNEK